MIGSVRIRDILADQRIIRHVWCNLLGAPVSNNLRYLFHNRAKGEDYFLIYINRRRLYHSWYGSCEIQIFNFSLTSRNSFSTRKLAAIIILFMLQKRKSYNYQIVYFSRWIMARPHSPRLTFHFKLKKLLFIISSLLVIPNRNLHTFIFTAIIQVQFHAFSAILFTN